MSVIVSCTAGLPGTRPIKTFISCSINCSSNGCHHIAVLTYHHLKPSISRWHGPPNAFTPLYHFVSLTGTPMRCYSSVQQRQRSLKASHMSLVKTHTVTIPSILQRPLTTTPTSPAAAVYRIAAAAAAEYKRLLLQMLYSSSASVRAANFFLRPSLRCS